MKKSELISIIKLAVREELKTTLPELLSEIKTQNKTTSMSVEKTEAKIKKTKQSDSGKLYSRNEKLNEALRATVGGIPQEGQLVSSTDTSTQTDFNGNKLSLNELPESISNALTRDYSELLTAIDKKKGS
tara:strand:- start:14078 stop:14467 length:390 start_codon:yes stop_codon:yes gene_type:complete